MQVPKVLDPLNIEYSIHCPLLSSLLLKLSFELFKTILEGVRINTKGTGCQSIQAELAKYILNIRFIAEVFLSCNATKRRKT